VKNILHNVDCLGKLAAHADGFVCNAA